MTPHRTTRPRAALGAFLAMLALAGTAHAADPKIDELVPSEAIPGGVVKIKGINFSDLAADIVVTVGTERAVVLEPGLDSITIFVPHTVKPGKLPVQVEIGKARSNKKILRVKNDASAREEAKQRDLDTFEGAGDETAAWKDRFLILDVPKVQKKRGETFIAVKGQAKYPDGCVILVSFKLDDLFSRSAEGIVKGSRFQAKLGPFPRRLFAGNYAVEAEFEATTQPGRIRRLFRRTFKGKDRDARKHALDRQYVHVGTTSAEQDDLRQLRSHFRRTIEDARRHLTQIEDRFHSCGRSLFVRKNGKVDEDRWEDWLRRRSMKHLGSAAFDKKAKELAAAQSFLKGNRFQDGAWREWLDYRWRTQVLELAREHAKFRDSWEILKFPKAVRSLEEALATLMRLSQKRSQELYEGNGMSLPKKDQTLGGAEAGAGIIRITPGVVAPARVEKLLRKAAAGVGL